MKLTEIKNKGYFESGKVAEITNFVNGLEDGKSKYYNENGQLYYDNSYIDGELQDPIKYYDDISGKLIITGTK